MYQTSRGSTSQPRTLQADILHNVRRCILPKNHIRSLPQSFWISHFPFFALPVLLWNTPLCRLARGFLVRLQRRHPATRTFGTTSGRTTLVQLSSHELHSLPSCSPFCGPLGSRTRLNEFRRFSSLGVFGNPFRSFCDYRPPQMVISVIKTHTTQRNIDYLKLIDESSRVLEYDAVLAVYDEFR